MTGPTFGGLEEVAWVGIQSIVAAVGLGGLIAYTIITGKIRTDTLAQNIASRRPFFIVDMRVANSSPETLAPKWNIFVLRNLGPGTALNVEWDYLSERWRTGGTRLGAVGVGMDRTLRDDDGHINPNTLPIYGGLYITYSDTTGRSYWTKIGCEQDGVNLIFSTDTGDLPN